MQGSAGWGFLFSVDGQGEGPKAVVVGALGVIVGYLFLLGEIALLGIELVREAMVVWDLEGALLLTLL